MTYYVIFYQRVYFIPAKSEGNNQTHAKGKLVERWKNVARRLRSVGAIDLDRKKIVSSILLRPPIFPGKYYRNFF